MKIKKAITFFLKSLTDFQKYLLSLILYIIFQGRNDLYWGINNENKFSYKIKNVLKNVSLI